jgi:hypothetical protein
LDVIFFASLPQKAVTSGRRYTLIDVSSLECDNASRIDRESRRVVVMIALADELATDVEFAL